MKSVLLFTFLIVASKLFAQFHIFDIDKYYDEPYYKSSECCYSYDYRSDTSYFKLEQTYEDHLDFYLVNTLGNTRGCSIRDKEVFLSFDSEQRPLCQYLIEDHGVEACEDFFVSQRDIPAHLMDTVEIYQNCNIFWGRRFGGYRRQESDCDCHCKIRPQTRLVKLRIIKPEFTRNPDYDDFWILTHVQIDSSDVISKNIKTKILCPDQINQQLIFKLNQSLIDLGFLEDKERNAFVPDIKEALIQFQLDNDLLDGFIDEATLEKLNIKRYDKSCFKKPKKRPNTNKKMIQRRY